MTAREPRDVWVDTGEVKLHYLDWPGEEPALLCIHGLTGNGRTWDTLAVELGQRHRVIAVDVRGRGLSDKPPAGQYGFAAHARDMAALLQSLGGRPAVAVGWSMGAYISAILAGDHPELVSHAVFVDGGGAQEGLDEAELRKQAAASMQRIRMVFPSLSAYMEFWRSTAPWAPWTEHFQRYLVSDVEERADGSVRCRSSAEGISEDLFDVSNWNAERWIPRVKAPTLVLWAPVGLADPAQPIFSRATQENVAGLLPNGRLAVIEGASHYSIGFAPGCVKQVAAAMEEFLHAV